MVACRGLNGIDGQLSSFLGLSDPNRLNVALIGDLTALYDFAGLWGLQNLAQLPIAIIVINNGGGKIFARKFPNRQIQNPHSFTFASFAHFWRLPYQVWPSVPASCRWEGLIELQPEEEATSRFWNAWDKICREALAGVV